MAKILLVEDDNNLREIYEARLQAEGYDIVAAPDGETALAVAKQEMPDLVISDVMMPRISGFEMLDILRNTEGLKDVKVIMLTALGQAEDKSRADKLGADRYLVKSQVTLEDIVKSAADLLGGGDSTPAPAAEPVAEPAPVAPVMPAPAPVAPAPVVPAPAPVPVPPAPIAPAPAVVPAPVAPVAPAPAPTPAAPPVPAPAPVVPAAPAPIMPAPTPAPAAPAPAAQPDPGSAQMMADAVKDLLSDAASTPSPAPAAPAPPTPAAPAVAPTPTPQPEPIAAPPAPAPEPTPAPEAPATPEPTPAAPAPAEPTPVPAPQPVPAPPAPAPKTPDNDSPTPADGSTDADSDGVVRKKVIKPLDPDVKPGSAPDLSALLAKEGITDFDKDEQATVQAGQSANLPHQPGHVISPNPVSADGKPVDPNSIAL
jgi:CheY-like chemotaxis protein